MPPLGLSLRRRVVSEGAEVKGRDRERREMGEEGKGGGPARLERELRVWGYLKKVASEGQGSEVTLLDIENAMEDTGKAVGLNTKVRSRHFFFIVPPFVS